jgi:CDP-paratose 2-epimerase
MSAGQTRATLITGGAGFIGANVASRLLAAGERVILLDDLSRPLVERNVAWLRETHGPQLELRLADVRDRVAVRDAVDQSDHVFHFAAQVAVTTSLEDPLRDFDVNARGTLNVLEAIRTAKAPPSIVFTSTNKVYGALDDVALVDSAKRYEPSDRALRENGISEQRRLDFHSPYGCSKGAADQYVLDYAHTFGLRAVVFRMSCIYGPRQFGTEDQGWVAHFLIQAMRQEPITIYGNGKQVRDVLFVGDLVDALLLARANIGQLAGEAFNIGGGAKSTLSLLELLDIAEALEGRRPRVTFAPWRTADQRYYVSDTEKFSGCTGWRPEHGVEKGIERLHEWLRESARKPATNGTRPTREQEILP